MTDFVITAHAAVEIHRRGIEVDEVRRVVSEPEQKFDVRPGRIVVQSRISVGGSGKNHLLRVFIDIDRHPAEVVTAYRTSKIEKYWRRES